MAAVINHGYFPNLIWNLLLGQIMNTTSFTKLCGLYVLPNLHSTPKWRSDSFYVTWDEHITHLCYAHILRWQKYLIIYQNAARKMLIKGSVWYVFTIPLRISDIVSILRNEYTNEPNKHNWNNILLHAPQVPPRDSCIQLYCDNDSNMQTFFSRGIRNRFKE